MSMTSPPAADPFVRPTDPNDTPVLRLRSPGEVVAALPALLGYHARKSIVLVVLAGDRHRVRLTMRLDLPERRDRAVWTAVAGALAPGLAQAQGTHAMLIVVDGDDACAQGLIEALTPRLEEHSLDLMDALVVADGRYRSVLCRDVECCPADGKPVPPTGAATAAAVVGGRVIRASRDDLRAEIEPPSAEAAERAERVVRLVAMTAAHGSVDDSVDGVETELRRACEAADDGALTLDQAARLAVMVAVGEIRDQAYLHLITSGVPRHRRLWAAVCRLLPVEHSVVPHVLFALAAYLDGDGAVATVALEAAEQVDPSHPSVRLLSDVLAAGIPPAAVRDALARSIEPRH